MMPDSSETENADHRRQPPVHRWFRPVEGVLHSDAASGVLLLLCAVAALVLANSPWASSYAAFWQTRIGFSIADFELYKPLLLWINDGLMTIFFFSIGLEIKHELALGELREPRKAVLPAMSALGGMLIPAGIYLLLQGGRAGESGWGIPMATDIAFVVGFLALLGGRVPNGLKILLLSVAIVDDLGAVLVIALFYSTGISLGPLALAGTGLALAYFFNRIGVRTVGVYVLLGAGIWLAVLKSGIHPTIAGVALGLLTPARAWYGAESMREALAHAVRSLRAGGTSDDPEDRQRKLGELEHVAYESVSPLDRLEEKLHFWVAFVIMPLFALANAGVELDLGSVVHPVAVAVAVGLVLGKPLGIFLFGWLAVKLGLAKLPTGVNWSVLLGGGCLTGVGFTMSLFIAGLALEGSLLAAGKIGTLAASTISAVLGLSLLYLLLNRAPTEPASDEGSSPEAADR